MKIEVSTVKGVRVVNLSDIIFCQADGNHAKIYLNSLSEKDKKYFSSSNSLKEIKDVIKGDGFYKCIKSSIVNFNYFVELDNNQNLITMSNGVNVKISREKKNDCKQKLREYIEYFNKNEFNNQ